MRGKPVLHQSPDWLYKQVSHATNTLENDRIQPWQVTDAPEPFVDAQLQGIVGLEVIVTDIQGKWKMSQNKSTGDFEGVKRGLSDPSDPHQCQIGQEALVSAAYCIVSWLGQSVPVLLEAFLDVSFDTTRRFSQVYSPVSIFWRTILSAPSEEAHG